MKYIFFFTGLALLMADMLVKENDIQVVVYVMFFCTAGIIDAIESKNKQS